MQILLIACVFIILLSIVTANDTSNDSSFLREASFDSETQPNFSEQFLHQLTRVWQWLQDTFQWITSFFFGKPNDIILTKAQVEHNPVFQQAFRKRIHGLSQALTTESIPGVSQRTVSQTSVSKPVHKPTSIIFREGFPIFPKANTLAI